jgi:hypothetical protein
MAISSNYVVSGTGGDSDLARRIDFEVSDHYGLHNSPTDEFDKRFFLEWKKTEWNSFYNFMITCVQLYLEDGVIIPETINLNKNRVIHDSSKEFWEFAEMKLSDEGKFEKDELLKEFKSRYPGNDGILSNTFTKWITAWAEYQFKSLKIIQKQSNSRNIITIIRVQQ